VKSLEYFRFGFNRIEPYELTKIVDKTHILFILTNRFFGWPPDIRKYELKGALDILDEFE
jgi:hypothetical protein